MVALGWHTTHIHVDTSYCSSSPSLDLSVAPLHAALVELCSERNPPRILICYTHSVYQHMSQNYLSFYATNILGLDKVLRPVERRLEILPAIYTTAPSLRRTKPGSQIRPLLSSVQFLQPAKTTCNVELQLARNSGHVIARRNGRRENMARKI
jgi:hypothetical protein